MSYLENPRVMNPPRDSLYSRLEKIHQSGEVDTSYLFDNIKDGTLNVSEIKGLMDSTVSQLEEFTLFKGGLPIERVEELQSTIYFANMEIFLTYFAFRKPKLCSNLSLSEDLAYQLYLSGNRDVPYNDFATDLPITYVDISKANILATVNDPVNYMKRHIKALGIVFTDYTYAENPLRSQLEDLIQIREPNIPNGYSVKYLYDIIVAEGRKTEKLIDGRILSNAQGELFMWRNATVEPLEDILYTMQSSDNEAVANFGIALDMAIKGCILKRLGDYRGRTEEFSTPAFRAAQSQKKVGGTPKKKKGKKKTPPRVSPYSITYMQSSDVPWIPPEDAAEAIERELDALNAELQRQSPNTRNHYKMIWVVERYIHQNNIPQSDIYSVDESRGRRNRYGDLIFKKRYLIKKLYTFDETSDDILDTPTVQVKRLSTRQNPIPDLVNFYFHVYDIGTLPLYAPFLEHEETIDIESLMDAEPEFVTYGFEFLAANEDDENYEDMKALHLGKIDYLVIGSAGGSAECYVLVSSPKMYKAFVEYMMTNPVLDYTVPADADYIIDNIRNPNAFVFVKGKPHMAVEARKGKLPIQDPTRHNPYNAVEELTMFCELDSYEVAELMREFYPKSVLTPNEFIAEQSRYSDTHIYYSADFAWIGTKGRTLRIRPSDADRVTPVYGNIFDDKKICAVAEAPAVFDFQIPFFVGYCEVRIIDGEEMREYEDYTDYYHYDEDDDGEIEITIRDGNHRTFGALASGNDAYVIISDNQYQDYENWIKSGKPANLLYEWLEDNLI